MLKKVFLLLLIASLLFVSARGEELNKEDFIKNAPKDYDKLLQAYIQMVDFAFRWKELYEKEAQLNKELLQKIEVLTARMEEMQKTLERMDKTIEVLQNILLKVLKPQIGIMGIYNFSNQSFSLGAGIQF